MTIKEYVELSKEEQCKVDLKQAWSMVFSELYRTGYNPELAKWISMALAYEGDISKIDSFDDDIEFSCHPDIWWLPPLPEDKLKILQDAITNNKNVLIEDGHDSVFVKGREIYYYLESEEESDSCESYDEACRRLHIVGKEVYEYWDEELDSTYNSEMICYHQEACYLINFQYGLYKGRRYDFKEMKGVPFKKY